MTVIEILFGNIEISLTFGILVGALTFIYMACAKYINKKKYGLNYDSGNPLIPKLIYCVKMTLGITGILFIVSLFETADCIYAIYEDRPNAESYCQPKERNRD
jgi:hypothetical protein